MAIGFIPTKAMGTIWHPTAASACQPSQTEPQAMYGTSLVETCLPHGIHTGAAYWKVLHSNFARQFVATRLLLVALRLSRPDGSCESRSFPSTWLRLRLAQFQYRVLAPWQAPLRCAANGTFSRTSTLVALYRRRCTVHRPHLPRSSALHSDIAARLSCQRPALSCPALRHHPHALQGPGDLLWN